MATPDSQELAGLLVEGRFEEAKAKVVTSLAAGAKLSRVMIEDLASAARRLNALWASDQCDFFEVTHALDGVKWILREIVPDEDSGPLDAPRILVLPTPGETHELGAEVVTRVFRLAGWRAVRGDSLTFLAELTRERYDTVGFSLSCDRYAASLSAAIRAARKASRNPRLAILVGGPVFASNERLATGVGADFCVSGVNVAVNLPDALLQTLRT